MARKQTRNPLVTSTRYPSSQNSKCTTIFATAELRLDSVTKNMAVSGHTFTFGNLSEFLSRPSSVLLIAVYFHPR